MRFPRWCSRMWWKRRQSDDISVPLTSGQGNDSPTNSAALYKSVSSIYIYIVSFCPLQLGFASGFSTLIQDNIIKELLLSSFNISLYGTMLNAGGLAGAFAGGMMVKYVEIEKSLSIAWLPNTIGWLAIIFAQGSWLLCIGRFLVGLSSGAIVYMGPLYTEKLAQKDKMCLLCAVNQLSVTFGIVMAYSFALFMPWRWLSFVGIVLSTILTLCIFCIPRWLARMNMDSPETSQQDLIREDIENTAGDNVSTRATYQSPPAIIDNTAETSEITRSTDQASPARTDSIVEANDTTRGTDQAAPAKIDNNEEANEITRATDQQAAPLRTDNTTEAANETSVAKNWLPLTIGICLLALQQLSGVNIILFYVRKIFKDAEVTKSNTITFGLGIVQIIFTGVSTYLLDQVNHRKLLLTSAVGTTFSLFSISIAFHMQVCNSATPNLDNVSSIASVFGFVIFIVFYSLGMGAIPWFIISEILPVNMESFVCNSATLAYWVASFLVTMTIGLLLEWSLEDTFTIYSVMSCLAVLVINYIPRTRDRNPPEVTPETRDRNTEENQPVP